MSVSKNCGTASLSKSQRNELAAFRRRNFNLLKNLKVHEIVQIWRDGYVCGAIHGYDQAISVREIKKPCNVAAQRRRLKVKLKARK